MHLELLLSAGKFPINTVGEPGTHGAVVTGTQGIGVNTPNAAAVALATVGLASELHIPKGRMLTIGLLSIIVAAGRPVITLLLGNTVNTLGATPNEHWRLAPPQTSCPIVITLFTIY